MNKIIEYKLKNPCKIPVYMQGSNMLDGVELIDKIIIYEPTLAHLRKIPYSFIGFLKDEKRKDIFDKSAVELHKTINSGVLLPEQAKLFNQIIAFIGDKISEKYAYTDNDFMTNVLSLLTTSTSVLNEADNMENRSLIYAPACNAWLTEEDMINLSAIDILNIVNTVRDFFFEIGKQIGI